MPSTTAGWKLTPEVLEVNGLPVGIQQLNHRVVTLIDLAADGRDFSLDHCHVFSKQILSIAFKKREKKVRWNPHHLDI